MLTQLFTSIQMLFAPAHSRMAQVVLALAKETGRDFNEVEEIVKKGEGIMADHSRITADREAFIQDNPEPIDQNVRRNTNNKRARILLISVICLGLIFSVKGLQYYFSSFYGPVPLWLIVPVALVLASTLVTGSIYINNMAEEYRSSNQAIFIGGKIAAYVVVWFIPTINLIEGFDSQYNKAGMTLNIIACIIDIVLHSTLVAMSASFITAQNSREAIKIMGEKNKEQRKADKAVRLLNEKFIPARNKFNSTATQFVYNYKRLEALNAEAAKEVMYIMSNFLIWMINNKVMHHAILPYHANQNGQPEMQGIYFTPENDTIRRAYDKLSSVTGFETSHQLVDAKDSIQDQEPLIEDRATDHGITKDQVNVIGPDPKHDPLPQDYDSILDGSNPNLNDKSL